MPVCQIALSTPGAFYVSRQIRARRRLSRAYCFCSAPHDEGIGINPATSLGRKAQGPNSPKNDRVSEAAPGTDSVNTAAGPLTGWAGQGDTEVAEKEEKGKTLRSPCLSSLILRAFYAELTHPLRIFSSGSV